MTGPGQDQPPPPVPQPRVLLVEDDQLTLVGYQRLLQADGSLQVDTAIDGIAGLATARATVPDLIVSDYEMPGMNGFELCRMVKTEPRLAGTMFVVLTGHTDTALKVKGLNLGVDDYLTKPVEGVELIARVRAMIRTKRLVDQLREDKLEMKRLHGQLEQSFENLLSLLIHLMDLSMPGAAGRGTRLAELCRQLADRFSIGESFLRDLELASLLHEFGKVVDPARRRAGPEATGGSPGDDWQSTIPAVALMEQVERLKGASELIGAMYENWDGTGMPNHYQQGQIPLRSRLLRVGTDFLAATEAAPGRSPLLALETLQEHRGTWYDPLALIHLESIVRQAPTAGWHSQHVHVGVEELHEGMVLANDLSTTSGVKLLNAGATITRNTLEIILRRHGADPIVQGAWVVRR